MSKALGQFAVVCENEQTFSLGIKPADIEEPWKFWRKQIKDGVACVRIASCRNKTSRLVQNYRPRNIDMDKFAIHFHMVALAGLDAEISAWISVDRNASGLDQRIALTPRANAGGGEEAV